jgi:hypothetical protein
LGAKRNPPAGSGEPESQRLQAGFQPFRLQARRAAPPRPRPPMARAQGYKGSPASWVLGLGRAESVRMSWCVGGVGLHALIGRWPTHIRPSRAQRAQHTRLEHVCDSSQSNKSPRYSVDLSSAVSSWRYPHEGVIGARNEGFRPRSACWLLLSPLMRQSHRPSTRAI